MSKRDKEPQAPAEPPVPVLSLDPASAPVETLPGPEPAEPGAASASDEPKRRRRRRAKPEPEVSTTPEGVTLEDVARCEMALTATFEILSKVVAKKRGAHWVLDGEESGTLGRVWTTALAPYLPKVGAAVPWAAALAVTFSMVKPRLELDAEVAAANPSGPVAVP